MKLLGCLALVSISAAFACNVAGYVTLAEALEHEARSLARDEGDPIRCFPVDDVQICLMTKEASEAIFYVGFDYGSESCEKGKTDHGY
jgi:hypothetical protein